MLCISVTTLKVALKLYDIGKWIAAKRPVLTEKVAALRLAWCLERKDWTYDDWKTVVFSDESSVERGAGARRLWCFRTPKQKWDRPFVQIYKKGYNISIMVWGAIWIGGRSDLNIMVRSRDGQGGYTQDSYLDTLERTHGSWLDPARVFMQDNAPIHTAKRVTQWFVNRAIRLLLWPPYSPDLNPIEHC